MRTSFDETNEFIDAVVDSNIVAGWYRTNNETIDFSIAEHKEEDDDADDVLFILFFKYAGRTTHVILTLYAVDKIVQFPPPQSI